ncbi:MAG TPA: BON domain-containing protein [Burkholderiales bacterium]
MKSLLAACTVALAAALGVAACASPSDKERTMGQATDDAVLTAKVKSAIATDVGARAAAAVNVETYRGVVQLSGFADSSDQASRAVEAAKKVSGVKSVKNDLRLKSS